jgi:hypothetical protein
MKPPSAGARTGAIAPSATTTLSRRAAAAPTARSRIAEYITTTVAAPPRPCTKRARTSSQKSGASAEASAPSTNTPMPRKSGGRLPQASERGPKRGCPTAMASRKAERESWMPASGTPNSPAIAGMPAM